jgi:phosphate transport system substrate-binding protein
MWHNRIVICVTLALLTLVGCKPADPAFREIKIKGSDTVLPIAQQFAEQYKNAGHNEEISVTGGGSGVGIASLLEGTTDIAMSSRDMKISEKLKLSEQKVDFVELTIAYDALAVCVNPNNPVRGLTREQLEGIYTGAITNWQDVGGKDLKIVAFSRENSSGTHEFFKTMVLNGKEFAATALMQSATGAIIQAVEQTEGAIGYVGLAYLEPRIKALPVSYDQGKTFVQPSLASALDKTYPIVRPLYFYYPTSKKDVINDFLSYITSAKGQDIVRSIGYIPVNAAVLPTTLDSTSRLPKQPVQ